MERGGGRLNWSGDSLPPPNRDKEQWKPGTPPNNPSGFPTQPPPVPTGPKPALKGRDAYRNGPRAFQMVHSQSFTSAAIPPPLTGLPSPISSSSPVLTRPASPSTSESGSWESASPPGRRATDWRSASTPSAEHHVKSVTVNLEDDEVLLTSYRVFKHALTQLITEAKPTQ